MHHINTINPLHPYNSLRLESIVLGAVTRKLAASKKIPATREFASWTRLNLNLLSTMETLGYQHHLGGHDVVDVPRWNHAMQARNAFDIVTGFFTSNGLLDKNETPHLLNERCPMLTDVVPMVIRKAIDTKKISTEDGLALLETINLFNSNLARPVPGSWLDQYCRENPTAPICLVARASFHDHDILRGRANLGFIALAEHFKLLEPMEAVSVLKSLYGDLGTIGLRTDMTVGQAEVILETAGLGEHLPTIRHTLADAGAGYVVDGVWAEICQKHPVPQICTLIHEMPVGRAVVDALVTHKLVEKTFIKSLVDTMVGSLVK